MVKNMKLFSGMSWVGKTGAVLLVVTVALLAWWFIQGGSGARHATQEEAREPLTTALDSWVQGLSPEQFHASHPTIQFSDDTSRQVPLLSYKIVPAPSTVEGVHDFAVNLTVK